MELKEKLDVFFDAAIEAAKEQSSDIIDTYTKEYQEKLDTYRLQKEKELEAQRSAREARVRKEVNREVSDQAVGLKQELHEEVHKREQELMTMVQEKLDQFRQTKDYLKLLEDLTNKAKNQAKGADIQIFLSPSDQNLKDELALRTGCVMTVGKKDAGAARITDEPQSGGTPTIDTHKSHATIIVGEVEFGGGIRAVILEKNRLIDESFSSKLQQEKELGGLQWGL